MPAAERKGDANTGGGRIVGNYATDVFINDKNAALLGSTVSTHVNFKPPHVAAKVVEASTTVFANGKGVTYKGAKDSCGHKRSECSPNVFVGNLGGGGGNEAPASTEPKETIAGIQVYSNPYSAAATADVIAIAGKDAVNPAESEPNAAPAAVAGCGDFNYPITDADYEKQLSASYKLKALSIGPNWKHKLVDQRGLKSNDIACHLKSVAAALEQLKLQYPGFNVNSGFRQVQSGTSDHELGYAADCQWSGITHAELLNRCVWAAANITNYQIILEIPPSSTWGWMHISTRPGKHPTKPTCTWKGGSYDSGFAL